MTQQPDLAIETATRLTAVYETIASTSMRDMPVCNDALSVEALGFQEFDGHVLGIVITPWFMNLTLVPNKDSPLLQRRVGEKEKRAFPAGRFDFVHGDLQGFGRVLTCSLYSPMFEFDDPAVARTTALAAMEALMDPANIEDVRTPRDEDPELAPSPPPLAPAVDRRRFLRGELREGGA